MAVLTADKIRPVRIPPGGLATAELPLAGYTNFTSTASEHAVYKGSIVVCDVSDTDGYFRAAPLTSSVNAAAGDLFGGVALEYVKVTSADTADGSKKVTVARNGVWGFAKGSLAQTDVGATVYASDDTTVASATANNFRVGILEEVDATYAWVNIEPCFLQPRTPVP